MTRRRDYGGPFNEPRLSPGAQSTVASVRPKRTMRYRTARVGATADQYNEGHD